MKTSDRLFSGAALCLSTLAAHAQNATWTGIESEPLTSLARFLVNRNSLP
jgi:hypothetical protein